MTDKKNLLLLFILLTVINISALVMPHPQKTNGIPPQLLINELTDNYPENILRNNRSQPDSILVIRVDFSDQAFSPDGIYPYVGYPQDFAYFDKYMQNLRDFYLDASNEQYNLKYRIAPTEYRAPYSMSYYGDDAHESTRRVHLVKWLVEQCDNDGIDFSHYLGVIVFHAGAGQESDINSSQTHTLWSSYLSRNTFRNILKDPEDEDYEDYQGIETSNGGIVNRVAFLPASEFHDDFTEDFSYEFDIMGPLANQFGRILGFPALNGNTSSTAGTGNFCIMGTGTWNFNGKIPPLPSAWVRYFAGWSEPTLIANSTEDLQITYPMSKQDINKIYKVELSDKEYFLIENRQQNFIKDIIYIYPNGDTLIWDIHTFSGSENYDYSQGGIPIVNLMKNDLRGNEWDYHMPYDYDDENHIIGSGLFIWHIDENVIEANLANNTVNGNPAHYGVALEEADGIEHLSSTRPDYYMRGSHYDSFRKGNNDYFGKQLKIVNGQEVYSFPTANSYYDSNITLEIYNISPCDTLMTFSVRFLDEWAQDYAQADFEGENYLEPFVNELDEVLFFHSDSRLTVFKNNTEVALYNALGDTLAYQYTFDGVDTLLIPIQDKEGIVKAKLYKYNTEAAPELIWSLDDFTWAGPPLYIESLSRWVLYLNKKTDDDNPQSLIAHICILDQDFNEIDSFNTGRNILSNGVYHDGWLVFACRANTQVIGNLYAVSVLENNLWVNHIITETPEFSAEGVFKLYAGNFEGSSPTIALHYTNGDTNRFYTGIPFSDYYTQYSFMGYLFEGYKSSFDFPFTLTGQPVFKDIDKNGRAEVILPHANGFRVYTLSGQIIKDVTITSPQYENATGGGIVAINAPNSSNLLYLIGTFSANRLIWFDENLHQLPSKTKTLALPMRTLPYIQNQNIYQATDDGRIYTIPTPEIAANYTPHWSQLLGSYNRNAFWQETMTNTYQSNDVFVKNETYVYPNPFIAQHHDFLRFRIMTTLDTPVNIKIYNIAGQLVAEKTEQARAYTPEPSIPFDIKGLSSGLYFALVTAKNKTMTMKFAIER